MSFEATVDGVSQQRRGTLRFLSSESAAAPAVNVEAEIEERASPGRDERLKPWPTAIGTSLAVDSRKPFRARRHHVLLLESGSEVPAGRYVCADCGHVVTLQTDLGTKLPRCPDSNRPDHRKRGWHSSPSARSLGHRSDEISKLNTNRRVCET